MAKSYYIPAAEKTPSERAAYNARKLENKIKRKAKLAEEAKNNKDPAFQRQLKEKQEAYLESERIRQAKLAGRNEHYDPVTREKYLLKERLRKARLSTWKIRIPKYVIDKPTCRVYLIVRIPPGMKLPKKYEDFEPFIVYCGSSVHDNRPYDHLVEIRWRFCRASHKKLRLGNMWWDRNERFIIVEGPWEAEEKSRLDERDALQFLFFKYGRANFMNSVSGGGSVTNENLASGEEVLKRIFEHEKNNLCTKKMFARSDIALRYGDRLRLVRRRDKLQEELSMVEKELTRIPEEHERGRRPTPGTRDRVGRGWMSYSCPPTIDEERVRVHFKEQFFSPDEIEDDSDDECESDEEREYDMWYEPNEEGQLESHHTEAGEAEEDTASYYGNIGQEEIDSMLEEIFNFQEGETDLDKSMDSGGDMMAEERETSKSIFNDSNNGFHLPLPPPPPIDFVPPLKRTDSSQKRHDIEEIISPSLRKVFYDNLRMSKVATVKKEVSSRNIIKKRNNIKKSKTIKRIIEPSSPSKKKKNAQRMEKGKLKKRREEIQRKHKQKTMTQCLRDSKRKREDSGDDDCKIIHLSPQKKLMMEEENVCKLKKRGGASHTGASSPGGKETGDLTVQPLTRQLEENAAQDDMNIAECEAVNLAHLIVQQSTTPGWKSGKEKDGGERPAPTVDPIPGGLEEEAAEPSKDVSENKVRFDVSEDEDEPPYHYALRVDKRYTSSEDTYCVLSMSSRMASIGRDPKSTVALGTNAIGVSREHAKLRWNEVGVELIDSSSFGTLINGVVINKNARMLTGGEHVKIGRFEFILERVEGDDDGRRISVPLKQ